MAEILVSTHAGCWVFEGSQEPARELPGRNVGPLAVGMDGGCVAVVDESEIWQRCKARTWSRLAAGEVALQSLVCSGNHVYAGGLDDAVLLRISTTGRMEKLRGFDDAPGRHEWFASGPPLGVRSLAASCDGEVLLAAVHVGGMPRSVDGGNSWTPTIPVRFDVHEVRAHPSQPNVAAAATAVGLCVTKDGGARWSVVADGLAVTNSLAVAVLEAEVLFSIGDGPFPARSQIWRWPLGGGALQPVRDGLPEWLQGKVDTAQLTAAQGRAALCDGGGNLWVSNAGSGGWQRLGTDLGYASGVLIV